ncbi:signal peptide peptidase SppA [Flavobacteriaceae bacterium]|nr:signal peptide peptidase SppA [Flavobacteriaceae bacterium]MDB4255541.1 signal peptide peptidase SppA [Flavobacteriaceae bacterium]
MNFIKSFFASILGTLTALGIFFVMVLLIISGFASLMNAPSGGGTISDNSVLKLDLNGTILDRAPTFDELQRVLGLEESTLGLPNIIAAIDKASKHDKIKGISLRADFISAGWAQTRSIRNALLRFKESGKFIYSYGDIYSQKGYYLSSVSDSIYLNPLGALEFKGLASEVLYYKNFQDEYGLKMEVIRQGKYKSAVEPYLENEMSPANRYQIKSLLKDIWETLKTEIAHARNLVPEILDIIIEDQKINIAEDALTENLIDGLIYKDIFEQKIKTRMNIAFEDDLKIVSIEKLNNNVSTYNASIKDRIAVVYARGPILYGEGTENIIAQGVFVETLETLAKDDWIKAVVLRIESPGGSALTSELLWRAIENLKEKKPFIVSMGNVAASGGYYIAAGADQIFADPLTITGSIGVFATLPNANGLMKNLGINAQTVETHKNALGYSPFQPLSKAFEKQTLLGIENIYTIFKKRVIDGRGLSPEAVENIAQGRVWTGKQAVKNGLVDYLGGLDDALAAAAKAANLENYNKMEYPIFKEDLESILSGITPSLKLKSSLTEWLPKNLKHSFEITKTENSLLSIQALVPFELSIK